MPAHDNIAGNADPDVGWFVSFQAPDGNPFGVEDDPEAKRVQISNP
jgi:hypothetical protein